MVISMAVTEIESMIYFITSLLSMDINVDITMVDFQLYTYKRGRIKPYG